MMQISDQAFDPNGTYYALSGPDQAPVLVLIHGLGLNSDIWLPHQAILDQRFRVLRYDLWGHGRSVPAGETITLTSLARQLRHVLDHLEIGQATLIGFSLGGMINRRFAIDHPDRARALVILNSPHERSVDAQSQVEARARTVRDAGAEATLEAALLRWFTAQFRNEQADYLNKVRTWRAQCDPESYAQSCWVLAAGVTGLIRPEPPVRQPTLVMTCDHDSGSTPAMANAIADEIAGAKLIIVPGLQHMGLCEQPALFTTPIVDFLKTLADGTPMTIGSTT